MYVGGDMLYIPLRFHLLNPSRLQSSAQKKSVAIAAMAADESILASDGGQFNAI
jgi:hypothetical protein